LGSYRNSKGRLLERRNIVGKNERNRNQPLCNITKEPSAQFRFLKPYFVDRVHNAVSYFIRISVVKSATTLAIIFGAGVLLSGAICSMPRANAQTAEEFDLAAGAWTAGSDSDTDDSNPDAQGPPLDIQGCWVESSRSIEFVFDQSRSGRKLTKFSTYQFGADVVHSVGTRGKLQGSVSSTGFEFSGHGEWWNGMIFFPPVPKVFSKCSISGRGTDNGSQLTITFTFHEACARSLGRGPFSISLTPCP
jgi:hypothetical protein